MAFEHGDAPETSAAAGSVGPAGGNPTRSPARLPELVLLVIRPGMMDDEYYIQANLSIGRNESNTVVLNHERAERIHAVVVRSDDGSLVLETTAGADLPHVAGEARRTVRLEAGTEFTLCGANFRVVRAATGAISGAPARIGKTCLRCERPIEAGRQAQQCVCDNCGLQHTWHQSVDCNLAGWLPSQVGPYSLRRLVARGGMGLVFYGLHRETELPAAVKMPLEAWGDVDTCIKKFSQEAAILGQLRHPNLIRLQAWSGNERPLWLAMDWVTGRSLADVLNTNRKAGSPPSIEWVSAIMLQTARGLAYLHGHGVVHRDLKPGNLLIAEDETVKIADVGIARSDSVPAGGTTTGTVSGTQGYIAPERFAGQPATAASDIFSLGALWYEMLALRPPLGAFAKPDSVRAGLPTGWNDCIIRCLSPNPAERPTAIEVESLLESRPTPAAKKNAASRKRLSITSQAKVSASAPKNADPAKPNKTAQSQKKQQSSKTAWALKALIVVVAFALYKYFSWSGDVSNGLYALRHGHPHTAMKDFRSAADVGSNSAMYQIALLYDRGEGLKQNRLRAYLWFSKAASAGSGPAMNRLGLRRLDGPYALEDYREQMQLYRINYHEQVSLTGNLSGPLLSQDRAKAFQHARRAEASEGYKFAMQWFRKSAATGDGDAMNNIGLMYAAGRGVKPNFTKAMEWFQKGAAAGSGRAMYSIGLHYVTGLGLKKDHPKALAWFRKSAAAGYGRAMFEIGWLYTIGVGVEKNPAKAKSWFSKAMQRYRNASAVGDRSAMCHIGDLYSHGFGMPRNPAKAMKWYHKAAAVGSGQAMFLIGKTYTVGSNDARAMTWYRKAAKARNAAAMKYVAITYLAGMGLPVDHAKGMRWLRRAAISGSGGAMVLIGTHMLPNGNKADAWFHRVMQISRGQAASGSGKAMVRIGSLYSLGWGVRQDSNESTEWFRRGAAVGRVTSLYEIGVEYFTEGQQPPLINSTDIRKAIKWLHVADRYGSPATKRLALRALAEIATSGD